MGSIPLLTLLHSSLTAGYSFFIPDLIGGREGSKADEELYLRWVQACTYMPAMQFATPPWDYSSNVSDIVDFHAALHIEYAHKVLNLARLRVTVGTPILRPMWYRWPDDAKTYAIEDQFMVGDDLLVAPVLEEGAKQRKVYLPKGEWIDHRGVFYNGPLRLLVKAPIDVLPRFKLHMA